MTEAFDNVVDSLDAAIFTGDHLIFSPNRDVLRYHLERWRRELNKIEDIYSTIKGELDDNKHA